MYVMATLYLYQIIINLSVLVFTLLKPLAAVQIEKQFSILLFIFLFFRTKIFCYSIINQLNLTVSQSSKNLEFQLALVASSSQILLALSKS